MDIIIATAQSRLSKYWKNNNTTWESLVEKLKTTTRTTETVNEFKNMKKADKDSRKDVGGFVGGGLKNGRRKLTNVISRYLVCLDADYASEGFVEVVKKTFDFEWVVYSTHSHTPEKPRLRLIIPLSRPVNADEYQAVSRKIAQWTGIDNFDDSTYEPHRLMYYPSTSYDGEFLFEHNKGLTVDVEELLDEYSDWKDVSLWPVSSRVDKARNKDMKKQGDPLEKPRLIGAFCRTYSVTEAIETFLADVYDIEGDRGTYKNGSTSGGVVLYEDKFSYSHHGTDPCGGKLCNAWDLVRIHKFGDLDADAEEGTPVSKLPSFIKMSDFAANDKRVRTMLVKEKTAAVKEEFGVEDDIETEAGVDADVEPEDDSWMERLVTKKNGSLASTIDNIKLILENDPNLKEIVGLNEFDGGKPTVLRHTLWGSRKGDEWTDTDDANLRWYLEKTYELYAVKKTDDALGKVMRKYSFHPAREYLEGLVWDGVQRLETLFIDYLGAEDIEYTRIVTRKTLCGAVARVFRPGVKFDTVLVLVGEQGIGKSYILSLLGGKWFNDSISDLQGKNPLELLQGSWIIELGELRAIKNATFETVKQFITKTHDTFRAAYARRPQTHPRQCIFFGSTNNPKFLSDPTGNRRFLPVGLDKANSTKDVFGMTKDEVNQIWAEAKYLYEKGEKIHIEHTYTDMVTQLQESYYEESDMAGMIADFVERKIPENWKEYSLNDRRMFWYSQDNPTEDAEEVELVERDRISAIEVYCELLGNDIKRLDRRVLSDIRNVLRRMKGWQELKSGFRSKPYGYQRGFGRKQGLFVIK